MMNNLKNTERLLNLNRLHSISVVVIIVLILLVKTRGGDCELNIEQQYHEPPRSIGAVLFYIDQNKLTVVKCTTRKIRSCF